MNVVIPVLTGYERCAALVERLYQQSAPPANVLIINNGLAPFETPALGRAVGLEVYTPGRNLGVAASWNHGLAWSLGKDDYALTLVLNDDVVLAEHSLATYTTTLTNDVDDVLVLAPFTLPYAAWCVRTRLLFERVGPLDEQFWPAYYEDDDLRYRIALAGFRERFADNDELGVSNPTTATTSADLGETGAKWLRECYEKNRRLYDAKWGAQPPHELYSRPYDPSSIDVERGGYHHLHRTR
jgi:GT2 family glycosyltransferase